MAFVKTIPCSTCGKGSLVNITHHATICNECKKKSSDIKKQEYLSALSKLTIEERLTKIEEYIYNKMSEREPFDPNTIFG